MKSITTVDTLLRNEKSILDGFEERKIQIGITSWWVMFIRWAWV